MGDDPEFDFSAAIDLGAEMLADSIIGPDPSPLGRLLRDPVVSAMMAADGVRADALESLLREVAARLGLTKAAGAALAPGTESS